MDNVCLNLNLDLEQTGLGCFFVGWVFIAGVGD